MRTKGAVGNKERTTNLEEADDEEVEVCDASELLKEVLEDEGIKGVFGRGDVVVWVLLLCLSREAAHRDTPALFCLLFSSEEPHLHCCKAQKEREREREARKKNKKKKQGHKKVTQKEEKGKTVTVKKH